MKRALQNALRLAAIVGVANAQWTGGPTGPVYYSGGNVGIGTSSPIAQLELSSDTTWPNFVMSGHNSRGPYLSLVQSAGTHDSPSNVSSYEGLGVIQFKGYYGGAYRDAAQIWSAVDWGVGNGSMPGILLFATTPSGSTALVERMRITASGNVGIGTTNPQYKLAIDGAIGARDIIVTNAPWSDYVFRPGYRLRPLSEVSAFIQKHRHLPEIPSEAEVKENGVSVAEMQAKLLAKVEELTLHLIEANKRIEQLERAQLEGELR